VREVPFLGPVERFAQLSSLLAGSAYSLCHAPGLASLVERYENHELQGCLLMEEHGGGLSWLEVLDVLKRRPEAPYLIVLARCDAERWVCMLERGVFDVITEPATTERVVQALDTAERRWTHCVENARLRELRTWNAA
jgi:DNA-binding NtrC family response regulator